MASRLADLGLLGGGCCIIELGAGNAELSLAIARRQSTASFVFIDKIKPRRNAEGQLEKLGARFERIRIGSTPFARPRTPGRRCRYHGAMCARPAARQSKTWTSTRSK